MVTVPISEVVPLIQWIQIHHAFKAKLDILLYQTGFNLETLHLDRFGVEVSPCVWEDPFGYRVVIQGKALTFEVLEEFSLDEALLAFNDYQEKLFGASFSPVRVVVES